MWVRNTTSVVTPSPNGTSAMKTYPANTNAEGSSSGLQGSARIPEPLGRTTTPVHSDMAKTLPLPFPLPKDFVRVEENIPTDIPSVYLQRRCPICFSGTAKLQTSTCALNLTVYTSVQTDISVSAQAIVCVDANFAQRRRHSRHPDPLDPHPDTHFLSVNDVESMKRVVEHARPSGSSDSAKSWAALPDDTLDDCEKAFTAAQGHIAKSSNAIFADTALMALLCRHDRPLFLVNMTSAGKRQYYALALIRALFLQIPDTWVIGLLYDVACQLERSMRKVRASDARAVPGLIQAVARLLV